MGKSPPTKHLVALAALPNLGAVSAGWLYNAGIKTPAALRKLGAIKAFRRVAMSRGGDVTSNLLFALDGALARQTLGSSAAPRARTTEGGRRLGLDLGLSLTDHAQQYPEPDPALCGGALRVVA